MNLEFFSDQAAWYWRSKTELMKSGEVEAPDAVLIGSSVTFHGVNTTDSHFGDCEVLNLALNGLARQHQYFVLDRYLRSNANPKAVVLELRDCRVAPTSWVSGPAWRFWMTEDEFASSGFFFWEPSRSFEFVFSRLFASYAFRRSIDNWISQSAYSAYPTDQYHQRNRGIVAEMKRSSGFTRGGFARGLDESDAPRRRAFPTNVAGHYWLDRIIGRCETLGMDVIFFLPPVPEFVQRDRDRSRFDKSRNALIDITREKYPDLRIEVLSATGFDLSDFADDRHLSHRGAEKLSEQVGRWFGARQVEGE